MEAYPHATMLTSVWPRSGAFSRNLEAGATHDVQPAMTGRNLIFLRVVRSRYGGHSSRLSAPRLDMGPFRRHCTNFTQRAAAQHAVLPLAVYVCLP